MSNFTNSPQYKEALENYRQQIYKDILNPTNVIIAKGYSRFDDVYLFYNQNNIQDIFFALVEEYKNDESELGLYLGCDIPKLINYTFMGVGYKAIYLWYDKQDDLIPKEFTTYFSQKTTK